MKVIFKNQSSSQLKREELLEMKKKKNEILRIVKKVAKFYDQHKSRDDIVSIHENTDLYTVEIYIRNDSTRLIFILQVRNGVSISIDKEIKEKTMEEVVKEFKTEYEHLFKNLEKDIKKNEELKRFMTKLKKQGIEIETR